MPFDPQAFDRDVSEAPQTKAAILRTAEARFEPAKEQLIKEFLAHPVTKDIQAGGSGTDQDESGLMSGYGNLFAFIGFNDGSDPITEIELELYKLQLNKAATIKTAGNNFVIKIRGTTLEKIIATSQIPELQGFSWVRGIEEGISDLGHFLSRLTDSEKSKSKQGYQVKADLQRGPTSTRPTPYLSKMFEDFARRLEV